ncbi:oxygen-independent coproporphyrinogen III oxidase [Lentisphaera marina]|uniref:oxygen-independent coproporphyrinogen III oxidase n=1 Tax=Lentisphaera marina TaxID=1111041 RepID=UPI002366D431|nr:oxygen-independent coproporphyrinogen III oxidase [Lentisphaera marina]MDD7984786.1 oxygen-independent coproporphyrinogen III oxidase [Lentisphaera marina]
MIQQETVASHSEFNSQELQLLSKPVPRYTSYPPVPVWNKEVSQEAIATSLSSLSQSGDFSALYIHIPFCQKLCWYCGCNTQVKKSTSAADPYLSALIKEMALIAKNGRIKINEIHFGGGTPNFLSAQQFHTLFCAIEKYFGVSREAKISIEADPRTLTQLHLETYAINNIKRLSFGVQDFNLDVQKAINRIQPYEMIKTHTEYARQLGFTSINFDLIVGLPKQSVDSFSETIDLALSLKPERFALFNFAYMPEQRKHMSLIKKEDLPDSETKMACTQLARQKFLEAGYVEIGLDHFALPNDELAVAAKKKQLHRNFMGFTVNQSLNIIGIGSSSISESQDYFWQNSRELNSYLKATLEDRLPLSGGHHKSAEDQERAWIIQSLMCNLQLDTKEFEEQFSCDPRIKFADSYKILQSDIPHYLYAGANPKSRVLEIHSEFKLFSRLIAACFDSRSTQANPMSTSL